MLTIKISGKFKKDIKRAKSRGLNTSKLTKIVDMIATGEALPAKYHNHKLTGNYSGCYECHIEPDWLLVYEIHQTELVLYLMRTGTHSDLF